MDLIDINISRLTNTYIESTHRVNKEEVVKNTKNTSVGDVVRILENRRKDILSRKYLNIPSKGNKKMKKPFYPETIPNASTKGWKKGRSKIQGHDKALTINKLVIMQ